MDSINHGHIKVPTVYLAAGKPMNPLISIYIPVGVPVTDLGNRQVAVVVSEELTDAMVQEMIEMIRFVHGQNKKLIKLT